MPIVLSTPHQFNPGHGQPAIVCNEVTIATFSLSVFNKSLDILVQYGNTVDGQWIPALAPTMNFRVQNHPADFGVPADPQFNILLGTALASAQGASLYTEVGKTLYQWLINKGHYQGTIV